MNRYYLVMYSLFEILDTTCRSSQRGFPETKQLNCLLIMDNDCKEV